MSYLHLNGITIPVRTCEQVHKPIAASSGYSPNGVYRDTRNSYARQWKVRTSLLDSRTRLALLELIGRRGDSWRFAVDSGTVATGATAAAFYSDKLRDGYDASGAGNKPVATVEPTIGGDGSPILDTRGVANAPWSGCTGTLLCEPGSSNIATSNQFAPATTAGFTALGATLGNSTSVYAIGTSSLDANLNGAGGSEGIQLTAGSRPTGFAQYSSSVYAKVTNDLAGKTVRMQVFNLSTGQNKLKDTVVSQANAWYRLEVPDFTGITAVDFLDVRVTVLANNTGGNLYLDGLQVEPDIPQVTAPIGPLIDTYGAGAGVRPDGDLQYSNLMTEFRSGFTAAAWVKYMQNVLPTTEHYVFAVNDGTGAGFTFSFGSLNYPAALVFTVEDGSTSSLATAPAISTDQEWHHYVITYDPTEPRLELYKNGASIGNDTTVSKTRVPNMADSGGDFHIGNISTGLTNFGPGQIVAPMVLPYVADSAFVSGLYNSASGYGGVMPGVEPIAASGSFLDTGEAGVKVFTNIDGSPHTPWWKDGVFQESGGELAFTMTEAQRR